MPNPSNVLIAVLTGILAFANYAERNNMSELRRESEEMNREYLRQITESTHKGFQCNYRNGRYFIKLIRQKQSGEIIWMPEQPSWYFTEKACNQRGEIEKLFASPIRSF